MQESPGEKWFRGVICFLSIPMIYALTAPPLILASGFFVPIYEPLRRIMELHTGFPLYRYFRLWGVQVNEAHTTIGVTPMWPTIIMGTYLMLFVGMLLVCVARYRRRARIAFHDERHAS